jgi:hypothetical protein
LLRELGDFRAMKDTHRSPDRSRTRHRVPSADAPDDQPRRPVRVQLQHSPFTQVDLPSSGIARRSEPFRCEPVCDAPETLTAKNGRRCNACLFGWVTFFEGVEQLSDKVFGS